MRLSRRQCPAACFLRPVRPTTRKKVPIQCKSARVLLLLLSQGSQRQIYKCRYQHRGPRDESVPQTVPYCVFFGVLCAPQPVKSVNSVPKYSPAAAAARVGLSAADLEVQI